MVLDLSKSLIAIVDDNKLYRRFLKKLIEVNFKANVVEIENPREMFIWLKTNHPALLVLDMEMPYMDGYTALQIIRQDDKNKDINVMVCTAISSTDLIARLVELKIVDYIVKNDDTKQIVMKIAKFFYKNPTLLEN